MLISTDISPEIPVIRSKRKRPQAKWTHTPTPWSDRHRQSAMACGNEAKQGRNSSPWLPDTCPGGMVELMRTVLATPRGWCKVFALCIKPFIQRN